MPEEQKRIPYDKRIGEFSCFLEMRNSDGDFSGSGFLYQMTETPEGTDTLKPHWVKILGRYVVTNRHVIFGLSENEKRPTNFRINIKAIDDSTQTSKWQSIDLSASEIENSIYVHPDPNVDVAVIDVLERELPRGLPLGPGDLIHNNEMINVECTDDVIVIGFPRGFYDQTNYFPIVKKGMISTAWGANFEGEPFFLIDAKLFPGSSGSAVLTKPIESILKDGQSYISKSGKQSALLGVFSGEPCLGDEHAPEFVGIVRYAQNIEETIERKQIWTGNSPPTVSIGSMLRPLRCHAK
jgi:hypothetical protein